MATIELGDLTADPDGLVAVEVWGEAVVGERTISRRETGKQ